jgi:serine/threonine protein phosphatase 1
MQNMSKRNFVISDIHGRFQAVRALFRYANVNPAVDTVRFLGDYIDRGRGSGKVVSFVREQEAKGAKVLKGNHELMHLMWLMNLITDEDYFINGGDKCIQSFEKEFTQEEYEGIVRWMANLPEIDEDDEYIYVHAGINPYKSMQAQSQDDRLWIREQFLYPHPNTILKATGGKKVVHGHTPMQAVFDDGARISIDIGAGGRRKLALVELNSKTVYEYDFQTGAVFETEISIIGREAVK